MAQRVDASTPYEQVELNGSRLPIKDFSDYVNMFMRPTNNARKENGQPELERFHQKNDRWEIVVSQSGGQFQQVNSVSLQPLLGLEQFKTGL
jgi:DNA topoisomerase-2